MRHNLLLFFLSRGCNLELLLVVLEGATEVMPLLPLPQACFIASLAACWEGKGSKDCANKATKTAIPIAASYDARHSKDKGPQHLHCI